MSNYFNREGYVDGCFVVFESMIKFCINEEEFISRKEEFYQIIKKTAHETKLDKEQVDYIWSRLKVMIENKRKELFEKNERWKQDTFNMDDFMSMREKIRSQSRSNSYFGDFGFDSYGFDSYGFDSFGFNRNGRSYNNFKNNPFQNTSQSIEISFKYFDLTKTANEEQLTKAYRIKSLKTHPDKPGGSKELFQECQNHKENCLIFIKRGF